MFSHVGQDPDPHWRRRYLLATALTAVAGGGAVAGAKAVGISLVALLAALAHWQPPPDLPDITLTDDELRLVEVMLRDPVLSEQDLPEAPPAAPPPPPPTPPEEIAEGPPTEAEAPDSDELEDMDEDVAELEQPDADTMTDALPLDDEEEEEEGDDELSDEAKDARQVRLDTMEEARQQGLLSMGDLGFDRSELDPGYVDDARRWDGLFGPRDSHLLVAALRDGRVESLRTAAADAEAAATGGFFMSHSSFGMGGGFFGGSQPIRLPPSRELVEAASPRFPRRIRKELGDAVDCKLRVTVDGDGHLLGVKILQCPEVLHEHALQAAHDSVWARALDGSEATVGYMVEFRK